MSSDDKELTYLDKDGNTVFTSAYLKNRKTCCKTNCLHCPYGHTLKTHFIELADIKLKDIQIANGIVTDSNPVEMSDLSRSLLESAFGKKDRVKVQHVTMDNLNSFAFGRLKDNICAVIEFSTRLSESASGRHVKEIFLKKEFQDQGLGIQHIKV